jgi:hypothetical protein
MEIKLLIGVTPAEMEIIVDFLNGGSFQCLLVQREA